MEYNGRPAEKPRHGEAELVLRSGASWIILRQAQDEAEYNGRPAEKPRRGEAFCAWRAMWPRYGQGIGIGLLDMESR